MPNDEYSAFLKAIQPTIGYTDLSTNSLKKCLEFGGRRFCPRDFVRGDFDLRGFWPGGFCPRTESDRGLDTL